MDINYDKILNCRCSCKRSLTSKKELTIMLYPCEHLMHNSCYKNLNNNVCPICSENIEKFLTLFDKDLHYQRFVDILSMSYYSDLSSTTMMRFTDSIFDSLSALIRMPFTNDVKGAKKINEDIFALNNMTMKVYGMEKLKKEKKKVFICNHVSHLEFAIIYYLFETGFLAAGIVKNSKLMDEFKKVIPFLIFDRGEKNRKLNIIEQMKNFVDKHGSICIFPEGIMKHPDVLLRFRTGAFHIGYPVYSITIRHIDVISDEYLHNFLYKLGGKRNINIEVHVNGPYYPPFSNNDIDSIRSSMAKNGKMVLSRVSNRDVDDKLAPEPI